MKLFTIGVIATCLSFLACGPLAAQFVHPGCLSTQADLDRMKAKVAANVQPWKSGFDRLVAAPFGQLGHTPNPQATLYASGSQPDNYITLARDAAAAYQVALRYHVTGDEAFAAKAVSILMAWANTHTSWNGNTNVSLRAGLYGYQLACAGELVRNYSGWAPEDFTTFKTYVRTRFYKIVSPNDVDRGFLFHHHGTCWSHYWTNWEIAAMATVIATGVLCDDETIFGEAIDYFHNGVGVGRITEMLHYLHPNGLGQPQEFGRDQGHASMLLPLLGTFCEIAWNQDVDLYSELDNAFLAMSENLGKYNLWYDVPYVPYVNCDYLFLTNIGGTARGSNRAGVEMVYNHYVNRMGLSAPYTKEAAEALRPEGGGGQYGGNSGGYDQLGFTTLTHTLDPIESGALPSQLRAHVKGGKITLSWRGSTYAKSYNVKRATTAGGPYINLATVGYRNTSYIDAGVLTGATCYYVVSANNPGGESAHSAEISAAHDRQLYGALIGTDGSAANAGGTKGLAMDGSLRNYMDAWAPDGGWVGLDLGAGRSAVITTVKYCPQPGGGNRLIGGVFEGSNTADFSSGVVNLFTITTAPAEGVLTTQSISNGNAFRYVRFRALPNNYCTAAEVQFIGNVTGMTPPAAAPTGLAVSADGNDQVALTWNSVFDATDYVIKRSTTPGGPYTVVEYNSPWDTDYTERKLAAATYYYVVSALNSVGETANSGEQGVQIVANIAPGSTTLAHAGSGGGNEGSDKVVDGNVNTKWFSGGNISSSGWLQIDLGAGNAQVVARYDLTSANDVPGRDPKDWQLQGSNDATNWTTLDTRTGETFASRFLTKQYTFANSTAYRYFKLNILSNFSGSAADGIQLAEWALMSPGSEPPPPSDTTPPAAPTDLTATGGDGAVALDWADNTEPDIARYTIHRSITGGGPYTAIATNVTFSSYSDTTVTNGTTYHYVVRAADTSLNESVNSAESSATPHAPPPPDAPADLTATVISTSRIDLAWIAANGAGSYTVKRSTTSGGPYDTLATDVLPTSYSDTTASPRTTYYYVVSSVNGGGESADSPEASARIEDLHQQLKFDETSGVTATDSSGNGRNATLVNGPAFASGRIGNALVFTATSSQHAALPAGLVSTLNDFTISTWVKPTTLANWARVFDFGSGTATNMFFAPQNGETGKPRFAIKIANSAEQQIDGTDALPIGVWTHVAVTLSGTTGTLFIDGEAVGTNNAITFKPSGMGSTTHNYLGRSQYPDPYLNGALDDFRIYGSALSAGEVGILAAGQLGTPQNVTAVPGDSQIALSWNSVAGATGYTVRRSSNSIGPFTELATAGAATSHMDSGLADGATWHYTVAAQGLPGPGADSAPVSATTYTATESWRFEHFSTIANTGNAADSADPDGDGWTNEQELISGTDPNDHASLLKISSLETETQDVVIGFPTVAGKSYRVEKSATMLGGSWITVADPVPGTGVTVEITDAGARSQPQWFYRISVIP